MRLRSLRLLVALAAAGVAASACSGDAVAPLTSAEPGVNARSSDSTLLAGLSASGPVASPPINLDPDMSWVSLVPGSASDHAVATITNLRTNQRETVGLADGGFDPLPIPATAGDSLEVAVGQPGVAAYLSVGARPAPRIVRTRPSRGQTDAPLNTVITIVFSEPVDPASVNDASVTLSAGAVRVAGSARVVPGTGFTVEFSPSASLAPGTTYVLTVSGVANLAGTPVPAPASIPFTTTTAGSNTTAVPVRGIGGQAGTILVNYHLVAFGLVSSPSGDPLPTTWRSRDPSIATVTPGGGFDGSAVGQWADIVGLRPGTTVIEGSALGVTDEVTVTVLAPVPTTLASPVVVDYRLIEASLTLPGSISRWSYAPDLVLRDTTGRGGSAIIGLTFDVPGIGSSPLCSMSHAIGSEPLALGREVFGMFGGTIGGRGWRAAGTEAIAHVKLRVPGPAEITIDVRGPIVPMSFSDPVDWYNPPTGSGSGEQCL